MEITEPLEVILAEESREKIYTSNGREMGECYVVDATGLFLFDGTYKECRVFMDGYKMGKGVSDG